MAQKADELCATRPRLRPELFSQYEHHLGTRPKDYSKVVTVRIEAAVQETGLAGGDLQHDNNNAGGTVTLATWYILA